MQRHDPPAIPHGYTIRHPTRDDLPAISVMTAASHRHDIGGVDFTMAPFEMEWATPAFDPPLDAWLVESAQSEAVAYIALSRRPKMAPEGVGWVHPDHRERGIGSLLIDLAEARAREIVEALGAEEPRAIVQWSNHHQTALARLLESRGYTVTRSFLRMSITLGEEEPPGPAWPQGVEMRTMRVGVDDEAVHAMMTTAFNDHWGAAPRPFEEWRAHRMGTRLFDPELWLLAWSGEISSGRRSTRTRTARPGSRRSACCARRAATASARRC